MNEAGGRRPVRPDQCGPGCGLPAASSGPVDAADAWSQAAQGGSGDDQAYTSEDAPASDDAAGDDDVVDAEIVDDESDKK